MGTRIIGLRPWLGPGMGGGNGSVDEDGNPVDPYGGPTTGDVADGIRDVVGGIQRRVRGEAKPDARAEPTAKAREVDCSQMPDETACNECLLKEGFIGPPITPRFVTQDNLINYEYQLYIANLRSAPLRFGFMVADKADPDRRLFSVDTLFDYLERDGFSRTVQEWHFNACEFDGFWLKDCTVVEAKGRYEQFLDEKGRPKYNFVEDGVFVPFRDEMMRQRAAIAIAGPQAKLLWCFMQARTMQAAIALGRVDPVICRYEPFSGGGL
ncbi:Tox-REase-5 domain-containing protein [Stenotrophomonas sp. PFBMAA-4]|uniref:Tox-REase-5 domain-containing protein n=1 Tax=Stenotrophomonas sp. PFBMAA-4 TaxID=3043301 RepID=UPI0024B570B0|nr:Tox-REase-5 domain-containing protein [Stenotrophomonas sp. PFBMAA-4]MDI9273764.1 Tox-REase-5 domain-containing protein [Stenotrophomonas sp. PFBMAA-4]